MILKPVASIVARLQFLKENLETVKLSKLCLNTGNLIGNFLKFVTRKNALTILVKGRITFANHLHPTDAVYHAACNLPCRTGRNLPQKYTEKDHNILFGLGRRLISDHKNASENDRILIWSNDDEQIMLNDFKRLMKSFLKDSSYEA